MKNAAEDSPLTRECTDPLTLTFLFSRTAPSDNLLELNGGAVNPCIPESSCSVTFVSKLWLYWSIEPVFIKVLQEKFGGIFFSSSSLLKNNEICFLWDSEKWHSLNEESCRGLFNKFERSRLQTEEERSHLLKHYFKSDFTKAWRVSQWPWPLTYWHQILISKF